ncbi:MAG: transketolase [Proteobacteria bacterium]|nr:transketolase [Pseudomonadota bacterium]
MPQSELDAICINAIRFLAVDAVQKAGSGHPGLPLGSASMAYVLWDQFLKFNPQNPHWPDRDRFVLSAGHGSALLYALLHLTGFDLSLEEIKRFRQWNSQTPGHPEYGKTPGVEATTGPLGQGFSNAVGMAIAEQALAARFNRPGHDIVDHFTYVIASDGDMMEGVTSESASLAGHLRLGKLIVLYDSNRISIEGSTEITFTENVLARFAAYDWHTQQVEDGDDLKQIQSALSAAKGNLHQPSFILVKTHIGYGSPHKQDSAEAHGEPLGVDEVALTKKHLGWPTSPPFFIPIESLDHMRKARLRGETNESDWETRFESYSESYPELSSDFLRVQKNELPENLNIDLCPNQVDAMATRIASEYAINALAMQLPELIGGSADLAPSTKTLIKDACAFESATPAGRNFHFGIREHGMGGILNGIALHRGFIPFGATFLIFSDYMRPPMRLAAMNGLPVIYVFTHDSIGLGEDGPTHQPVEHLLGLRSIPGMTVIRPADANETIAAWNFAVHHRSGPIALILTRQKLPILDEQHYPQLAAGVCRGGYILSDASEKQKLDLIIVATGSEVHLALESQKLLQTEGISARVVSLPCWNLFKDQMDSYRKEVLPMSIPLLAIEAGVSLGWNSYIGPQNVAVVCVDQYGASAPGEEVMREYGLNISNVCQKARALLEAKKDGTKCE